MPANLPVLEFPPNLIPDEVEEFLPELPPVDLPVDDALTLVSLPPALPQLPEQLPVVEDLVPRMVTLPDLPDFL